MPDLVIFNILIPLTDNRTGALHPPEKFTKWVEASVEKFGGLTVMGIAVEGHWYDSALPPGSNPVRDLNNCYKVGVVPGRIEELRAHIRQTARDFRQKCIYLERAGEADFIWDPDAGPSVVDTC